MPAGMFLLLAAVAVGGYLAGRGTSASSPTQAVAEGRAASAPAPAATQGVVIPPDPETVPGLSAAEKAQKTRTLLADGRKALSAGQFGAAKQLAGQALELSPGSEAAEDLLEEAEESRLEAEQEERDRKVDELHKASLQAISRGESDKALEHLREARKLDPANSKTFRLMEQAYRQKESKEARARREAWMKNEPMPGEQAEQPEEDPKAQPGEPASELAEEGEYSVQPDDVLQITVFEEPDLSTRARVSRNGDITFPLLGQVRVAGMSVSQVQSKLTALLEDGYLVHPQVQVFLDKPRNVFVTGQVHKPGSYPVSAEKPTTVMEMIALAGGFTQDADLNGTRIIRMVNGKKETIRVRASDVVRKGDKSKDEVVRAEDIIFVPESFF